MNFGKKSTIISNVIYDNMIIKEIRIKNFRSYYGDKNRFEFSDGLTIVIGDNGDGKTTFFEAIAWLLNTSIVKGEYLGDEKSKDGGWRGRRSFGFYGV